MFERRDQLFAARGEAPLVAGLRGALALQAHEVGQQAFAPRYETLPFRGGCRFVFIEARQERSFAQRADALGVRYAKGLRVEGINVSSGRPIAVTVYRAEGSS